MDGYYYDWYLFVKRERNHVCVMCDVCRACLYCTYLYLYLYSTLQHPPNSPPILKKNSMCRRKWRIGIILFDVFFFSIVYVDGFFLTISISKFLWPYFVYEISLDTLHRDSLIFLFQDLCKHSFCLREFFDIELFILSQNTSPSYPYLHLISKSTPTFSILFSILCFEISYHSIP